MSRATFSQLCFIITNASSSEGFGILASGKPPNFIKRWSRTRLFPMDFGGDGKLSVWRFIGVAGSLSPLLLASSPFVFNLVKAERASTADLLSVCLYTLSLVSSEWHRKVATVFWRLVSKCLAYVSTDFLASLMVRGKFLLESNTGLRYLQEGLTVKLQQHVWALALCSQYCIQMDFSNIPFNEVLEVRPTNNLTWIQLRCFVLVHSHN